MGSTGSQTVASGTHRAMAVCAALVASSAIGGSLGLATGTLEMGSGVNERLPFASPVLGGVALGLFVAVPFAGLAVAAWRGHAGTDALALLAGSVLVGWIIVEVAVIREFSPLQPSLALVGIGFVGAGIQGRRRGRMITARHTTGAR